MNRILHLTLKKKWFDMIASGEKKEEYREIKTYWAARLVDELDNPTPFELQEGMTFCLKGLVWSAKSFQHYDIVQFRNGYAKDAPMIQFEVKNIKADFGKEKWGAEYGKAYFVIELGDKININMTRTHENIALVEVPKGAALTGLAYRAVSEWLLYFVKKRECWYLLPPGPWEYICLSTEMTEEKAREVVEAFDQVVVTYYRRYGKKGEVCYTALDSFASLLTALGCDPAGTYAVLINANP